MRSTSRQGKCHHVDVDVVHVRQASPQDAGAIADVLVDARRWSYRDTLPEGALNMFRADEMSSRFARWLSEPHPGAAVFVAERAGGIVGYAYVHPSEDVDIAEATELNSIYIMEHVAGTGVAPALMDAAVEHARDRSDSLITLWVRRENVRARAFYEKSGYCLDGAERSRPHDVLPIEIHELRYRMTL